MAFLTWSNDFSTGVAVSDTEHKKLIALINELHESMVGGTAKDKVGEILDRLIKYTVEHFDHEERMLARNNYPGLGGHRLQHELLKKQVQEFRTKMASGGNSHLSIELLKFLKDWLSQHILKEDKKYGAFLAAGGVH